MSDYIIAIELIGKDVINNFLNFVGPANPY